MGYKWQKEKGSGAYRGALVCEVTDALFRADGQLHCYNPAGLSKAEAQPQAGNINNPTFKHSSGLVPRYIHFAEEKGVKRDTQTGSLPDY